MTDRTYKSYK